MAWIKLKKKYSPEAKRNLRRMFMLASSMFVVVIFFAWAIHDNKLNRHTKRGKYLEGVVSDKDTRIEGGSKGEGSTHYLVWVTYHYDGEEQRVLTSDYIAEAQWEQLSVGDSVSFIYQPKVMMANDSGKIWFQNEPVLELALQPALNSLRWYPMIATLIFLLGAMSSILHLFRRRN